MGHLVFLVGILGMQSSGANCLIFVKSVSIWFVHDTKCDTKIGSFFININGVQQVWKWFFEFCGALCAYLFLWSSLPIQICSNTLANFTTQGQILARATLWISSHYTDCWLCALVACCWRLSATKSLCSVQEGKSYVGLMSGYSGWVLNTVKLGGHSPLVRMWGYGVLYRF